MRMRQSRGAKRVVVQTPLPPKGKRAWRGRRPRSETRAPPAGSAGGAFTGRDNA
jgi:hypothetical protein